MALIRRSRRARALTANASSFGLPRSLSLGFLRAGRLARSIRLGMRRRMGGSFTQTRTRNRGSSGPGITTQHDAKFIYAKRRMPRSRRRRWKKFGNQVQAIQERDMGSRTVVRNFVQINSNSTAGNHIVASYYLYGQFGQVNVADDLRIIGQLENSGDPTANAGVTVDQSSKFIFKSAVMDLTFKNDSSYRDEVNPLLLTPSPDLKMELDIYEMSMALGSEETGNTIINIEGVLGDNDARTRAINGTGTEISYLLRGVTPFDLTYSLSRWRLKIWKKTKYFLNNQDVITYQVRDPRRHVAASRDLFQKDGFNRPGWTRIILAVAKTVPGNWTVGSSGGQVSERLIVGSTRKYLYKIEGVSEDRTRYV